MYPAAPPPMPPPATMRISSGLLFGVAALTLLKAAIELTFVNTDLSVYRDAYTGDTGSGFVSIAGATFGIFVAAGVSILAILNGHGRKNARIVTLVLGGLFLLCGGVGSFSDGFHRPSEEVGSGSLERVLPLAYGISVGVLELLIVLATLAALVLLALPPSNRFFQNREIVAAYQRVPQVHVVYAQPAPATPPPFGAFSPAPADHSPHTTSTPAIDPWAAPKEEYQPRHDDQA
jgi:hypothetical protein